MFLASARLSAVGSCAVYGAVRCFHLVGVPAALKTAECRRRGKKMTANLFLLASPAGHRVRRGSHHSISTRAVATASDVFGRQRLSNSAARAHAIKAIW